MVKPHAKTPQRWDFRVNCPTAEQVYLVIDQADGLSTWVAMQPGPDHQWTTSRLLEPADHRFRYFAVNGTTFINHGASGLVARPASAAAPTAPTGALISRTA